MFAEICKESEINENALDTISEQIEVHALFSKRGEESVSCTALLTDEGKVILANNSVDILCFTPNDSIQQLDTFLLEVVNIGRVLKMEPIDDLEIILCLTHAGQLAILCQQTWTVMHMCELERVKDFTIVSDVNQDCCVLVSTAAPEILLMNLPGNYLPT